MSACICVQKVSLKFESALSYRVNKLNGKNLFHESFSN